MRLSIINGKIHVCTYIKSRRQYRRFLIKIDTQIRSFKIDLMTFLVNFSVYSNTKRLFDVNIPKNSNHLGMNVVL